MNHLMLTTLTNNQPIHIILLYITNQSNLLYLCILHQISIPLSSNLNALKDAISADKSLGPIKRNQQRLFHLGKELKINRTLEDLGIGNYNVFSIHLHSLAPKTYDLQSDDEDTKQSVPKKKKRKSTNDGSVVDLAGDGGERSQPQQNQNKNEVVDLLDDSDDSDDDDIVVLE